MFKKILSIIIISSLLLTGAGCSTKNNAQASDQGNEKQINFSILENPEKDGSWNHAKVTFTTPLYVSYGIGEYEYFLSDLYLPIKSYKINNQYGEVKLELVKEKAKKYPGFEKAFNYSDMGKYSALKLRYVSGDMAKSINEYGKHQTNKVQATIEFELYPEELKADTWKSKGYKVDFRNSYWGRVLYSDYLNNKAEKQELFNTTEKQLDNAEVDRRITAALDELDNKAYETFSKDNAKFQAITQAIGSKIKSDSSDYDKLKAINDWMTGNLTYDNELAKKILDKGLTIENSKYTFVNFLDSKKGVCIDYAYLFTSLARYYKVNACTVLGVNKGANMLPHAWNIAFDSKNNKVIYVDTTQKQFENAPNSQFEEGHLIWNEKSNMYRPCVAN